VLLSKFRIYVLVISPTHPFKEMVLMGVAPLAVGTVRRIRWTCVPYQMTGHRSGSWGGAEFGNPFSFHSSVSRTLLLRTLQVVVARDPLDR
jgi:hypothetical protein